MCKFHLAHRVASTLWPSLCCTASQQSHFNDNPTPLKRHAVPMMRNATSRSQVSGGASVSSYRKTVSVLPGMLRFWMRWSSSGFVSSWLKGISAWKCASYSARASCSLPGAKASANPGSAAATGSSMTPFPLLSGKSVSWGLYWPASPLKSIRPGWGTGNG